MLNVALVPPLEVTSHFFFGGGGLSYTFATRGKGQKSTYVGRVILNISCNCGRFFHLTTNQVVLLPKPNQTKNK